jgi:hypothetical protein
MDQFEESFEKSRGKQTTKKFGKNRLPVLSSGRAKREMRKPGGTKVK